jgi:hypothetical protein
MLCFAHTLARHALRQNDAIENRKVLFAGDPACAFKNPAPFPGTA